MLLGFYDGEVIVFGLNSYRYENTTVKLSEN